MYHSPPTVIVNRVLLQPIYQAHNRASQAAQHQVDIVKMVTPREPAREERHAVLAGQHQATVQVVHRLAWAKFG